MENIVIQYCFRLPDATQEIFNLEFDAQKLDLIGNTPDIIPHWVRLDFHQCPNCPLNSNSHPNCPLVLNLVKIIGRFDNLLSYEEIQMDVVTEERHISQHTTSQRGISSLMGLLIATSGCPHTAFFKPMARFHLPLASKEETIYRATSMYMLAQYFLKQEGKGMDLDLEGLNKIYYNIELINRAIAKRLRTITKSDSSVNALILLDMYAKATKFSLKESLMELRNLFTPYLMVHSDSKDQNKIS
jgi:hypothetical protein